MTPWLKLWNDQPTLWASCSATPFCSEVWTLKWMWRRSPWRGGGGEQTEGRVRYQPHGHASMCTGRAEAAGGREWASLPERVFCWECSWSEGRGAPKLRILSAHITPVRWSAHLHTNAPDFSSHHFKLISVTTVGVESLFISMQQKVGYPCCCCFMTTKECV